MIHAFCIAITGVGCSEHSRFRCFSRGRCHLHFPAVNSIGTATVTCQLNTNNQILKKQLQGELHRSSLLMTLGERDWRQPRHQVLVFNLHFTRRCFRNKSEKAVNGRQTEAALKWSVDERCLIASINSREILANSSCCR